MKLYVPDCNTTSTGIDNCIKNAVEVYLRRHHLTAINPRAVLFDMDGVLYDSMRFHARSWFETACNHQLKCTQELFYLYEGRTGESTINELYQKTFHRDATEEEKQSIYKEKASLFNIYNDGKPMKGAAEVLANVRSSGLQSLIVTGSGQLSLIDKLDHNYPGHFQRDKMVTAFDVKYGKPHPEPYLMGLKKANIEKHEALVVENAPLGVRSAVAAGIFTIAVNTGPLEDSVLNDAGADLLFSDMESLANAWNSILEVFSTTKVK